MSSQLLPHSYIYFSELKKLFISFSRIVKTTYLPGQLRIVGLVAELHGKGSVASAPLERRLGVDATTITDVQLTDWFAPTHPLLQDVLRLGAILEEGIHAVGGGGCGGGGFHGQWQRGRRWLLSLVLLVEMIGMMKELLILYIKMIPPRRRSFHGLLLR